MIENEYGSNIIQNGEGTTTAGWAVVNGTVNGVFNITDGSMTQIQNITDDNRSMAYKLSYECIALRSVKSCFILYYEYRENNILRKCTRLLPIMSTGVQEVRFEVPDGCSLVKIICQGSLDVKNISLQHDTGLTTQQKNAIAELAQFDIISANTMIATACWFGTVSVNYLETNFAALDTRCPMPPNNTRLFLRIWDERQEYVTQTLSPTEVEDYTIIDPADTTKSNRVQVYYNAIGDHEDAYKAYTLTHPTKLLPDLTAAECEAFKVKVRKVLEEHVKKSLMFLPATTSNGLTTVMPVNIEGAGTDLAKPFGERRGQFIDFKDVDGKTFKQFCEHNDEFTGLKFTETGLMQYNQFTKRWTAMAGGVTIGGIGGTIFWKDKTAFEASMFQHTNVAHFGYNSNASNRIVGEFSSFFPGATFLGAEVVTALTPIIRPDMFLYNYGFYDVPFSVYVYTGPALQGTLTHNDTSFTLYVPPIGTNGGNIYYRTTELIEFGTYSHIVLRATVTTKFPKQGSSGGFVVITSPSGSFQSIDVWLPPNCVDYEVSLPIPAGLSNGHVTVSANCWGSSGIGNTTTVIVHQIKLRQVGWGV